MIRAHGVDPYVGQLGGDDLAGALYGLDEVAHDGGHRGAPRHGVGEDDAVAGQAESRVVEGDRQAGPERLDAAGALGDLEETPARRRRCRRRGRGPSGPTRTGRGRGRPRTTGRARPSRGSPRRRAPVRGSSRPPVQGRSRGGERPPPDLGWGGGASSGPSGSSRGGRRTPTGCGAVTAGSPVPRPGGCAGTGAAPPVVVDLGYGASPVTAVGLHERLRRVRPDVEVVGVEIDPARVAAARPLERAGPHASGSAGSRSRCEGGARPVVVRAFNVLRQYDESEVAAAWATTAARLAPGRPARRRHLRRARPASRRGWR